MPTKKKFSRSRDSKSPDTVRKRVNDLNKEKPLEKQDDEKSVQSRQTTNVDDESLMQKSKSVKVAGKEEQRKLIFSFVKKTFELGPKGLKKQFGAMKRGNDFDKMKVFMENNTKGKNRYKDVGCLDCSRVKLRNYGDNDYIHGNYVKTPTSDKRFICIQAPLEKTCPDFWAMIIQEGVENIMMLCNLTEKGAKKCHEYFPTNKDESLSFGDNTVRCLGKKDYKFKCKTKAEIIELELEVDCDGKTQKLKHYHCVDWPDRGVPPVDMAIIEILRTICVTKTPIIVHCSAGIGRTGSVVLIQYIKEMVQTGQQDQQYLYVHMVLINHWIEEGLLSKTVKSHVDKFTKQYKAMVIEK